MGISVAITWRVNMSKSDIDIKLNELAPMEDNDNPVALNIKAQHDTLVLVQEALRKLEAQIKENHP